LYLAVLLNFPLPPGSLALTVGSLALHAKLSAALYCIARKQQQPQPPTGDVRVQPPAAGKLGGTAATRVRDATSSAAQAEQSERAALDELEEEEEESDESDSSEAKRRGAAADRAFAATLSKRM